MLLARRTAGTILFALLLSSVMVLAQGARVRQDPGEDEELERDRPYAREQWFRRGRTLPDRPAAEMLHRAMQQKLQQRQSRIKKAFAAATVHAPADGTTIWTPMGPTPILPDSTGTQDYGPTTGRATAVAVDQTDPSGNTVYLGGAYGGLWKSTNAAAADAASVMWTSLLDQELTLAVGAIAVHPANGNILLVGSGEGNNAIDSYYGFGIYRSIDGGANWTLITATKSNASFRGLAFSRISWSRTNPNLVVAAATNSTLGSSYGLAVSAVRGIYYSLDAGATWEKAAVTDPGVGTPDPASVTSVYWNPADHKFYAVLRYHGLYASAPDDPTPFVRLANQPTGLTAANCPLFVPASGSACPVYRGELAAHPVRNELYFWFVDAATKNRGVWKSTDSGASWIALNTIAMDSCGDKYGGCGVEQGYYNLALTAVPNPADANATDLYAGAVNIFKCTINSANPTCGGGGDPYRFMNLTHTYGCSPLGSSSHVHPDEHQFDFSLSHPNILYFANDGGLNRTLDGVRLNSNACSHLPFDNLNTNMGSMAQFIWATPHPTDETSILGGTQDNGSTAVNSSTPGGNGQQWRKVNAGDGGYTAILPNSTNTWLTANNDISIQVCTSGINCDSAKWSTLVGKSDVGGDEGAFYSPYILDPQKPEKLIVGSCRVHRGNSSGTFAGSAVSYNFWTSTATTCVSGTHPMISALAAGGPITANGSQVIYAGTEAGQIFVTTSADGGVTRWTDRTPPMSLNPGKAFVGWRFTISSLAVDLSDASGKTAYATIQGFGSAHVVKTLDAGVTWTNIAGNLPDSPANNIAIDPDSASTIYVATDIGVFVTQDATSWNEVGPDPASGLPGYLPNTAVMRVAVSKANGKKLLIAATYGRGVWKADLSSADRLLLGNYGSNSAVASGGQAVFKLWLAPQGSFSGPVTLSCSTAVPNVTCKLSSYSFTLPSAEASTFTATVGIEPSSNATARRSRSMLPGFGLVLPAILFIGASRKRHWLRLLALVALLTMAMVMCSCGGGGSSASGATNSTTVTPPGSYLVDVTATSGTQSVKLTLSVNLQ